MIKANTDIREEAKKAKIPLWVIAERLGISEYTMIRRLRKELSNTDKSEIRQMMKNIAETERG